MFFETWNKLIFIPFFYDSIAPSAEFSLDYNRNYRDQQFLECDLPNWSHLYI